MKRTFLIAVGLLIVGCGVAWTQGPDRPQRGAPERGSRGDDAPRGDHGGPPNEHPPGHNPLMDALDTNHDHVISAEEIQAAATALLKLDKNGDGELSEEEFRPDRPPPPPPRDDEARSGRGPRDAGPRPEAGERGRGRGERPPRDDADRPGREGRPDRGFGPPSGGPGGPGGSDGPRGFGGPGGPPDGPRGFGGPPNPERFVEHALEFDANKDGMLDKDELLKFAEEMGRRQGGPGGGPGMRRPDGPRDGERPGDNGDQPNVERPQRPSLES